MIGDVEIAGDERRGDPPSPAYANVPDGAERAVVVIHEIMGRAPEIDAVCDRFAARGYAAVAPDLFHAGTLPCVVSVLRAMQTGADVRAVRQARRARHWLCERLKLPSERVGLIGFCFGGGFALLAGHGFGAVSANYGSVPAANVMDGLPPVRACFGGRDRIFSGQAEVLERRLDEVGVEHDVRVYPTVGHSFLTKADRPIATALSYPLLRIRYDAEVAEDAWSSIITFFDERLS